MLCSNVLLHIHIVQPFMSGTFIAAANGGKVEMDKNLRANVGQFVPSLRIAICTRVNERAPITVLCKQQTTKYSWS